MKQRKTLSASELQTALNARNAGGKWSDIAKGFNMPETTLRGKMIRAGLIQRGSSRGKLKGPRKSPAATIAAAVEAAAPTVAKKSAAVSSGFVVPSWYPLLRFAMSGDDKSKGASLFGPRGTGKSTAIRELSKQLGVETITMQCAANMQIDSLIGCWSIDNGTQKWIDGPLTAALRTDAWLLCEESNAIHPGTWSAVNTLTDRTGEGLRLPTGEVIHPGPNFRMVLLYNDGYAGTRQVNDALKDRLMPIFCGYLSAGQEIAVLQYETGIDQARAAQVVEVATMIRNAKIGFDLSPRALCRWIKLQRSENMSWREAFDFAILDLIGSPEQSAAQRKIVAEIANNTVNNW